LKIVRALAAQAGAAFTLGNRTDSHGVRAELMRLQRAET
jgi:hypothetical protein